MLCWFMFAGLGRVVRNQRSFHTEIDNPDPTLLISFFANQRSSRDNTAPAIWQWIWSNRFKVWCISEVSSFEYLRKGIRFLNQTPKLLSKHCHTEIREVCRPRPPSSLWLHNFPMISSACLLYFPLKSTKIVPLH